MAALTQMCLDSFASQVANNYLYYEFELFKIAYKYEQHNCTPRSFINSYNPEKTNDSRQDYEDLDAQSDCSSDSEGIDKSFQKSKHCKRETPIWTPI
jgi:hypothetical protein